MNLFSNAKRSTNSHDRIKRITETVGHNLAEHPDTPIKNIKPVEHLYVQVDGGHVATVEPDKRTFEAMTSVVFDEKKGMVQITPVLVNTGRAESYPDVL